MAKSILRVLLVTAGILLVPLIAMQFTREVTWTSLDFAVAGTLLLMTGLVYELAIRGMQNRRHRLAAAAMLALTFLLIWAQLAVGIV